jgi:hypothetical protein
MAKSFPCYRKSHVNKNDSTDWSVEWLARDSRWSHIPRPTADVPIRLERSTAKPEEPQK